MKKLLVAFFVLLMLFTAAETAFADNYREYDQPVPGTSIAWRVSLREAPDENSTRFKYLTNNEEFEILGETGDWYVINYPDSASGVAYALKYYIVTNPRRITLLSGTPVYAAPHSNKRVGYVSAMDEFVVIQEYDGYYVINLREASGFVPNSVPFFVQSEIDRYYDVIPTVGTVVNSNSLNVRLGPGTGWASIGRLRTGDTVQIVDCIDDEWYVILYTYKDRNIVAYVMAEFIQY